MAHCGFVPIQKGIGKGLALWYTLRLDRVAPFGQPEPPNFLTISEP
jgi:hypothetical protein